MRLIRKRSGQLRKYTVCRWSLLAKVSPFLCSVYDFSNVSWFSQLMSIHRQHHDHHDVIPSLLSLLSCNRQQRHCTLSAWLPLVRTFSRPQRERDSLKNRGWRNERVQRANHGRKSEDHVRCTTVVFFIRWYPGRSCHDRR